MGEERARPTIEPMPPVADDVRLPWDEPVVDPIAALAGARAELGDTFVVDGVQDRYLFVFSPEGIRSFYGLEEAAASKGVADWRMLRRKVPDELFTGRRTYPHELFRKDDTATLLTCIDAVLDRQVGGLADGDEVELFAWTRELGHRFGLVAWAGLDPADERIPALMAALDQLDGSAAFVDPAAMAAVRAADFATERAALAACDELLGAGLDEATAAGRGLFPRLAAAWADEPREAAQVGIARDVVLVHLGSMSNLFAALGWALADLVDRPALVDRLRAGEPGLAERTAEESVRLAQRSIMLRQVLQPVRVQTGPDTEVEVAAGATIATLLPLTNTAAGPGLDGHDPDRWRGRRLADPELEVREVVATFGHGAHHCPAQPFSLAAMARTLGRLVDRWDLALPAGRPVPLPGQVGGVARPATDVPLRLRPRAPQVR